MNDMESVYDANSLLDAFNKSKKGTAWKESVQRYEMNLLRNINQTQKEMKDGTYEQKDFYEFKLHERGKSKAMFKFCFKAGFEPAVKSA